MRNEQREKDFEAAAMGYCEDHSHCIYFEDGAEYGYQYAVEKVCEWLRENIYHRVYECGDRLGYPTADFLKDFRKAMQ